MCVNALEEVVRPHPHIKRTNRIYRMAVFADSTIDFGKLKSFTIRVASHEDDNIKGPRTRKTEANMEARDLNLIGCVCIAYLALGR